MKNKFNRTSKECLEPESCLCVLHFGWDVEEGLLTKHWLNGNRRYELNFKNGKQHGESKSWYSNGNLKQTRNWVNGKVDGLWTEWYENGNKESKGVYKESKLVGNYTTYYENGNKQYEGNSDFTPNRLGKQNGLTTTWNESGQKKSELLWENGKIIESSRKSWDEDGNERR